MHSTNTTETVQTSNNANTKLYSYDSLGNRIMSIQNIIKDGVQDSTKTHHTFNARNQLIKTFESDGKTGTGDNTTDYTAYHTTDYTYDKRGNLIGTAINSQLSQSFTFDATGMMTAAFTQGKGSAEYVYNGFRRKVGKLENPQIAMPNLAKESRYVLDMVLPYDNLLMVEGSESLSFVWGNGLLSGHKENVGSDSSQERNMFYYLQDYLGSPIRLVGADGSYESLAYNEFGLPKIQNGTQDINRLQDESNTLDFDNPFGFTGYQMDSISGMYFAQARYYDPKTGRFTAEDTHWHPGNMIFGDYLVSVPNAGLVPCILSISESKNLYNYVSNSPLRYVDPMGKAPNTVHNMVTDNIVQQNINIEKEVGVLLTRDTGRIDLIDFTTGYIWDVKPVSANMRVAKSQVQNYANRTRSFRNKEFQELYGDIKLTPFNGIPSAHGYVLNDSFTKEMNGDIYYVHHWFEGDGLILYTYWKNDEQPLSHQIAIEGWIALALAAAAKVLADGARGLGQGLKDAFSGFMPIFMPEEVLNFWIEMNQFRFDIFTPGPISSLGHNKKCMV